MKKFGVLKKFYDSTAFEMFIAIMTLFYFLTPLILSFILIYEEIYQWQWGLIILFLYCCSTIYFVMIQEELNP